MRNRLILICLLFSGFAGLAFELMWTRLLSFSFGSTTLSFSTVLAVFFGGLALGAFLSGRRSAGFARPLRVYGLIELGCGVAGLLLYPVLKNLGGLFASLDPGAGLAGMLLRFVFSAPLLLIPTVLMGATLPVVIAGVIENDEDVGRGTALIYGLNTLGACLGSYLVTYHLLPALGVFGTNVVAAAANLVAGTGALLIERTGTPLVRRARSEAADEATDPELKKWITVAAVVTGLGGYAAISLQIVWVRVFTAILNGTIYGVGAVLISVLIGIALGSIFIASALKSSRHPVLWFVAMQLATMISVLVFCSELGWIEYHLRFFSFSRIFPERQLHAQLFGTFLVLAIPALASGASFPLLMQMIEKRAENAARSLGTLYAANTVGSILGSLVTGFIIVPLAGSASTVYLALLLLAALTALTALLLGGRELRVLRWALAGAAVLLITQYEGIDMRALANSKPQTLVSYDDWVKGYDALDEKLHYFAEGEHASVVVNARGDTRSLVLNGLGQGVRRLAPPHLALESVLVAYVPMVHARATEKAMVVGLGAGATMELMSRWGVKTLRVVELEEQVVEAVRQIYAPEDPLHAPGVEVILNDARHQLLLEKNSGEKKYDLITSMPAHPWVAASIFTREFFELARDNLEPQGIFCTWFGVGKMDNLGLESLLRAFIEIFPYYVVYWVPAERAYFLVGGTGELRINLQRMESLHADPMVRGHNFFTDPRALLSTAYASGKPGDVPRPGIVNTDDSAFIETHGPRSSTVAAELHDFLPREYLLPELFDPERRAELFSELIETLLGTPHGNIGTGARAASLKQAAQTLAGADAVLSPEAKTYFRGRMRMLEGDRAGAALLFSEAAAGSGPHAERARKFGALLERDPEASLRALEALPPSTEVLLLLLDRDRARAFARVAGAAPNETEDAAGWLMWIAKNPGALAIEEVRARFRRSLGPLLRETSNRGVLLLAREVAQNSGMTEETAFIEQRLLERTRPANRSAQLARLHALIASQDRAAIAEQLDRLRFQGVSEEYLRWSLAQSTAQGAGETSEGEDMIQSGSEQ